MASQIVNVGVIGAGQMGCGIAHVAALAGYGVQLYDVSPDRIATALATINGNIARQVASGKLSEEDRQAAIAGFPAPPTCRTSPPWTSSSRLPPRTRPSSARSTRRSAR